MLLFRLVMLNKKDISGQSNCSISSMLNPVAAAMASTDIPPDLKLRATERMPSLRPSFNPFFDSFLQPFLSSPLESFILGKRNRCQIIPVYFDALIILHTLLFTQGSDIHNLLQFFKDGFARFERKSVQRFHILEYIYPTFKIRLTFLFLLVERRKLDKNKPQLVRKHFVRITVRKDNVRAELVGECPPDGSS